MSNIFRNWLKFNSGFRCCVPGCKSTLVDPAHVRTRGAVGDVDVDNVVPLCRVHHTEQHNIGIHTFQSKHGIDMEAEAKKVWDKWLSVQGTLPITGYYDFDY